MSAWYVFAALGFYPVNPVSGQYMIGSPLFKRIALNLPNGKRFTVLAEGNSSRNMYIQSAMLDGRPLATPLIRYDQIEKGGTLSFAMGPRPSTWAAAWRDSVSR